MSTAKILSNGKFVEYITKARSSLCKSAKTAVEKFLHGYFPDSVPDDMTLSSLAQSVEQAAVNHRVVGSSPTAGANMATWRNGIRNGLKIHGSKDREGSIPSVATNILILNCNR